VTKREPAFSAKKAEKIKKEIKKPLTAPIKPVEVPMSLQEK
jgi:hypothetical protein